MTIHQPTRKGTIYGHHTNHLNAPSLGCFAPPPTAVKVSAFLIQTFCIKFSINKHISLYIVYSTFIEFITISLQNFTFRLLILIKIFLQFFGIFIGYVSYYFLGQNIMHKCYCYCMRSVSRMQFHKHCLKGLFNCGF